MRHIPQYIFPVLLTLLARAQETSPRSDPLQYYFDKRYGQVEVGGPYAGLEFHESRPLPSRLSFYYPVANSIDVSTDYWKRGASAPLAIAIRIGERQRKWVGKNPWSYTLSPHRVTFESQDDAVSYLATYDFCKDQPALVFSFRVKNTSDRVLPVELYTHLLVALRTCQTYTRRDSAWTDYDSSHSVLGIHFDDADTKQASVFVQNVGTTPDEWTSSADELNVVDSGSSDWVSKKESRLLGASFVGKKGKAVAAFVYRDHLSPGESMTVVQIVGSCNRKEFVERSQLLATSWMNEVGAYESFVRQKAETENLFVTGDPWLDRSAAWARAILATNAHFLEDRVVPMPCPAEYNFFFTHDLLMTNLGAVNYDLERVKENLLYIASHANDNIIPHAYYWKDDGFKTEYCTPANWNHLWFVIVSASYLRHSQDRVTGETLLPCIIKSIEEVLTQKKDDNLMYAYRPDWWDIGWNEGPRAYITALTIRALRDYLFISSFMERTSVKLRSYEALADSMQASLRKRLWDDDAKYLVNYNGGIKDSHYYMGSLLAPVLQLLDRETSAQLVETAGRELADARIGVRNVMPPDFHTDSSKSFFKFVNDEAGKPYVYANGGVWPHNNAWYVLALQSVGRADEALRFLKATMTIDGIAESPMGQPAMYEYRFADPASAEFGKIDKPSFLWAGGFYLYSLYQLVGFSENEWNISVTSIRPTGVDSVRFSFAFGEKKRAFIKGTGYLMRSMVIDGKNIPSVVLPLDAAKGVSLTCEMGDVNTPYLESVNAIVRTVRSDEMGQTLESTFSSFAGHRVSARFITTKKPKIVTLDGKQIRSRFSRQSDKRASVVTVEFTGSDTLQKLSLRF